ncbi:MAG: threonine--tRNA ligase [Patescibacteria group bacterium]|jgi:threonyl-tRNA synthetase
MSKQELSAVDTMRHSTAHLLAAALQELYPEAKFGVGPVVENGFYYDVDLPVSLSFEDFPKIEATMREIQKRGEAYIRKEMSIAEAIAFFGERNQPYKVELLEALRDKGTTKVDPDAVFDIDPSAKEITSVYETGKFVDLCRGPHVKTTHDIGAFTLTKLAGAYWRGSEKNKMLQRVYGVAFLTARELSQYLTMVEEAKKRDHRKLGQELDLFMFHETAPGMPYWLPKGVIVYNELVQFWREEHRRRGYQEIVSPMLNKRELYEISGHYEHYWSDMFVAKTDEGEEYGVKAMNCPNAMVVFGSRGHSYRDLPLRLSDTDTLHRNELSGTLNGLLRVREFRQDDAHIFVSEDMIAAEFAEVMSIVDRFYSIFGLEYSYRLGTRPEKFMGDVATWDQAEAALKKILVDSGKSFIVLEGDGAFYGPKIDILMRDILGREWQMGTIQLDFQQPRRFNLHYTDAEGKKQIPVAIHRVIYGSMERFIGIIIEHFAGAFPVWLSPVQVGIVPVGESHLVAARNLARDLEAKGVRVSVDETGDTVGNKIRKAAGEKLPYALVIGDKEIPENGSWSDNTMLAVRLRGEKELLVITLGDFVHRMKEQIKTRHN